MEKLTGKPLIYASLGTLVNGLDHVYKIILETVGKLPEIQVVLSAGKNVKPGTLAQFHRIRFSFARLLRLNC